MTTVGDVSDFEHSFYVPDVTRQSVFFQSALIFSTTCALKASMFGPSNHSVFQSNQLALSKPWMSIRLSYCLSKRDMFASNGESDLERSDNIEPRFTVLNVYKEKVRSFFENVGLLPFIAICLWKCRRKKKLVPVLVWKFSLMSSTTTANILMLRFKKEGKKVWVRKMHNKIIRHTMGEHNFLVFPFKSDGLK